MPTSANFGRRISVSKPLRVDGRQRRLRAEWLEPRLVLAQTTGLFFNDPGTENGYVLFSPNTTTRTFLIDKDANVVNQWTSAYQPGLLAYLQPDGSLIRASAPHGQGGNGFIQAAGAGGLLERFDWNGTQNWTFSYDTQTQLQHHDFEVMPNGNILLIAWELKSEVEATQEGRDPSLPGDGYLYPDHIVEVQPDYINGGGTIVWEWHVWDHLVQEFDSSKDNWLGATGVEDHPELIDVNYVSTSDDGGGPGEDWTHANGIEYNAELDQILLSVREFSEFWVIDHSTTTAEAAGHTGGNSGKGGDLLYRWGNPQAYDRGDALDRILFYQHDAQWIPDGLPGAGNITVFNNGFGRPGADFTSIEEIAPPVDVNGNYALDPGQPNGPATTVWTYAAPVNFSPIISGAQRLPNGNTLIDFGTSGNFTEITPAGVEVWKYVNPHAGAGTLGPMDPIPSMGFSDPLLASLLVNFTFQAIHYPLGYTPQLASTVMARHLFYNQSGTAAPLRYDGNDSAINANDDLAIATNKTAYLPGGGATTFANVSSYSKGINGIMIDLDGKHGSISADDFIFRVGNDNTPSTTWTPAPVPSAISVRAGAGVGGSDRVVITWANNAIQKQWFQVVMLANPDTGLHQLPAYGVGYGDVFYFGNAIGDSGSGDTATDFLVNATDELAARNNPALLISNIPITNLYDFNRDGAVNATDQLAARNNPTNVVTALNVLSIGVNSPPNAPESGDEEGDSGLVSGLSAPAGESDDSDVPGWLAWTLTAVSEQSATTQRMVQEIVVEDDLLTLVSDVDDAIELLLADLRLA